MILLFGFILLVPIALVAVIVYGIVRAFSKSNKKDTPLPDQTVYSPVSGSSPFTSAAYSSSEPISPKAIRKKHLNEIKRTLGDGQNLIIALGVVFLCIFFVDSIYRTLGGFGATILFFATEFIIIYLLLKKRTENTSKALMLALPILIISFSYSLFLDTKGFFIPYATIFTLLFLQIVLLSGVKLKETFSIESIILLVRRIIATPILNLDFFFGAFRLDKSKGNRKVRNLLYIVLGLAVSIPFVLLLLSLFFTADPVFKEGYDNLLKILKINLTAERIIVDSLLGIFISFFAGATLIYNYVDYDVEVPTVKQPSLNSVFGFSFTLLLNIVLAAFSFIQIRFLFIGDGNNQVISTIGYAQYARQGFFELCFASALVFTLALTVMTLCKKEGKNPLYIRISVLFMSLFSGVIAISSAMRMFLYVKEYGLSIKRLNTFYGIIVILVSLLILIIKSVINRLKALKVIGISIIVLVTMFSLVNFDRIVCSYNTKEHIDKIFSLDLKYISELSYTSTPDLVDLYIHLKNNKSQYKGSIVNPFIDEIEQILIKRGKDFDDRPLFAYTLDDILIAKAFDRVYDSLYQN